ncbi:MAG: glycosyltransferase family 39 protein [Deltaproteobacteria bacterium]|nr:glycosyltransferase family 39 protein [Deltaproteobacteria bacterium]
MQSSPEKLTGAYAVTITLLCLSTLFFGQFSRDLWTPDEPRVAAISLEMSRTGDFVIPRLSGRAFIEKPPLFFAVSAGFIRMLGKYADPAQAIRLAVALFGVATLLMTFLLAKRLYGTTDGLIAAALLSTMIGFAQTFHWIRVDAALCFFVMAAVWSFAEARLGGRPWFLLLAGLFTAGAFLTKGPIGPVLTAIPCAAMFIFRPEVKEGSANRSTIFFYMAGLLVFILAAGAWIILLRLHGGEELWHEWFWVNQVGRLTGTAAAKGHIRTGKPFYYLVQTAADTMPWFPLVLIWAGTIVKNMVKHSPVSKKDIFLFAWAAGILVLLSLSATKRGIYMAPLLPAFALMGASILQEIGYPRGVKGYLTAWIWICTGLLALFALIPFVAGFLPHKIPAPVILFLKTVHSGNILAGLGVIICLYLISTTRKTGVDIKAAIFVTAFLYIGIWSVPARAVNTVKRMKNDFTSFVSRIPENARPRIAGFNLNETMLGCFYYYSDWAVPRVSNVFRVNRILSGKDKQFDSIIINKDGSRSRALEFINKTIYIPWQIIQETHTGNPKHSRRIFLITGRTQKGIPAK